MPVSPRTTAPPIQPPLGVLSNMFPFLSMIDMWVVSLTNPLGSLDRRGVNEIGCAFRVAPGSIAFVFDGAVVLVPRIGSALGGGTPFGLPACMLATQYDQDLTLLS